MLRVNHGLKARAASGMMAQQLNIDNISNNLANVQSVGFKKSRVDFQDLLYAHMQDPNATATSGTQIGMGVRVASTQKLFTQGQMQRTDNPYDMAIQGDGFRTLAEGARVEYELGESPKGPQATNVRVI